MDRRGRIAGGTLVGPRAWECPAELALAVSRGLRTRDLTGSTHAYPTYADGLRNAAIADVRVRLATPLAARTARVVLAVRRRRRPGSRVDPTGREADPGTGPGRG